jgi:hypothetical protein
MMNDPRKSDRSVVPGKSPNKAESAAEGMEGRDLAKGNLREQNALRTLSRTRAHSALERYDKLQERIGRRSSQRSCTTSTTRTCCARPTSR